MSLFQPVLNEKEQKLEKEFDKLDFYYANGEYILNSSFYILLSPGLERGSAGFGNRVILFAASAADTDGADDFSVTFERDASSKDHNFAIV